MERNAVLLVDVVGQSPRLRLRLRQSPHAFLKALRRRNAVITPRLMRSDDMTVLFMLSAPLMADRR